MHTATKEQIHSIPCQLTNKNLSVHLGRKLVNNTTVTAAAPSTLQKITRMQNRKQIPDRFALSNAASHRPRYNAESRAMTEGRQLMKEEFLDNELMSDVNPPNWTLEALKHPRLRRCAFDADHLKFEARLDGGLDGYCWKVHFGDKGPFVLKVVRKKSHSTPVYGPMSNANFYSFGITKHLDLLNILPYRENAKMPLHCSSSRPCYPRVSYPERRRFSSIRTRTREMQRGRICWPFPTKSAAMGRLVASLAIPYLLRSIGCPRCRAQGSATAG